MKWLRWGLTLELLGFGLLLAVGVAGMVAILLLLPGCPAVLAFSVVALFSLVPTGIGRLLCLGAPRETGVHAWLVAALAAAALSWFDERLFILAVLLNMQVLIAVARWTGPYGMEKRARELQRLTLAFFVASFLLGAFPLVVWGAWLLTSYVILVMDMRSQLVISR
jgi:hypothetical protein